MSRRTRPFAALFAIVALLFAQAMAAVHACDVLAPEKAPVTASAPAQAGDDCCDHDTLPADPACGNHCQQGNQAPDRVQPTVAPLLALGFMMTSVAIAPAPVASHPATAAPDLERDTQPPISIRNCCFRI
ncbi:MAG TPA: hypothetical protein VI319_02555 [Burkholderiales bacterium]